MEVGTMWVPGTCRDQKRVSESLESELQIALNYHMDAGNWNWLILLWTTIWVLETEPGSSATTPSALIPWAISAVLSSAPALNNSKYLSKGWLPVLSDLVHPDTFVLSLVQILITSSPVHLWLSHDTAGGIFLNRNHSWRGFAVTPLTSISSHSR